MILPNWSMNSTQSVKVPAGFFAKVDKSFLKFIWKWKGPRIAKTVEYKVGGLTLPNFKTYYVATVIKTSTWLA